MKAVSHRYLESEFNIERGNPSYYAQVVFELVQFCMELKKSRKQRIKKVDEVGDLGKSLTMFTTSIPFIKCKLITQYSFSAKSTDQHLWEIVQNVASGERWRGLFFHQRVCDVVSRNYSEIQRAKEEGCADFRWLQQCSKASYNGQVVSESEKLLLDVPVQHEVKRNIGK